MSSVYEIITEKIIAALEQGIIPWKKPWACSYRANCNFISKKPYRGVNAFVLAMSGFSSPYWLTYKQAKAKGGNVRKGEKSTPVVFWSMLEKTDKETDETKKFGFYRYYPVFNLDQIDGIVPPKDKKVETKEFSPIEQAENIVANMPQRPEIKHGGDRAFYRPSDDSVTMPEREKFHSPEEYYSTLFHELGHSTGHESRLKRKGVTGTISFGSDPYANEELVAELTAAFLCGDCGIIQSTLENSTAYIQNWLSKLRNDSKLIFTASSQAQKAADFISCYKQVEQEETESVSEEEPACV